MLTLNKKKSIIILGSILSTIIIIILAINFFKWISIPEIIQDASVISNKSWSYIANDVKPISKNISITNKQGNPDDIYIQVIDAKGNIMVQPTLLKVNEEKIIVNDWQIFNRRYVQAQATNGTENYKLQIKCNIE